LPISVQSLVVGEYHARLEGFYVAQDGKTSRRSGTLAFTIDRDGSIAGVWRPSMLEMYRVFGWREPRAQEAKAVLYSTSGQDVGTVTLTREGSTLHAYVDEDKFNPGGQQYQGTLTRPRNVKLPVHAEFTVPAANRTFYWPWHSNRRLAEATVKLLEQPMSIDGEGENTWILRSAHDTRLRIEATLQRRSDDESGYRATITVTEILATGRQSVTFHGGCLVTRRDQNWLVFKLFGGDKNAELWLQAQIASD
jgi:hypothetical protein